MTSEFWLFFPVTQNHTFGPAYRHGPISPHLSPHGLCHWWIRYPLQNWQPKYPVMEKREWSEWQFFFSCGIKLRTIMAADSKIFHSLPVWIKNHMWMLLFWGKALILQENWSCVMSLNNATKKKDCGNGLKDLSSGTDEPSTLSGSISWEHLVSLLLISGGTAVKWSNVSCGQQGHLTWWHHQYHRHISQRMPKRPGMLLCPILLRMSSQTIHFHFPKTLKSGFWSSFGKPGEFTVTIPRCSPHWSYYQIIFFTRLLFGGVVNDGFRAGGANGGSSGTMVDRDGVGFFVAQRTDHGFQEQCSWWETLQGKYVSDIMGS